jgi:hypothetical protein
MKHRVKKVTVNQSHSASFGPNTTVDRYLSQVIMCTFNLLFAEFLE